MSPLVCLPLEFGQKFIKEMCMKYKMLALIMALAAVSWSQDTQTAPATPHKTDKANSACCDKMAKSDSQNDHAACMRKHDGQEMATCCSAKDGKSCCGTDAACCAKDGKMAQSCCKGKAGMKCDRKPGKECAKDCCGSGSGKTA
jgi:hypothetical protein